MALSDGPITPDMVLTANSKARARMEELAKERKASAPKVSEPKTFTSNDGTIWTYVVLNDDAIRIEKCEFAEDGLKEAKADQPKTLTIPDEIAGLPVRSLSPDSCANLDVDEIICSDNVEEIGACAFRLCKSLRKLVLPKHVSKFDSHWFRSCSQLAMLVLPGALEKLDARIFDMSELKHLVIGCSLKTIDPGMFAKSKLESIEIADENPYIRTDGKGIYSKDGEAFIALAMPLEEYKLEGGTVRIARKAFSNFECLKNAILPQTVEDIDEFAYARTGIESFTAPSSLKDIKQKAFYSCSNLQHVALNEGIEAIGEDAFSDTGIKSLFIPSTIREIGNPIAAGCGLSYSGRDATFKISPDSKYLVLGENGGLYRRESDGLHLVRMMDPHARRYKVREGTAMIDDDAFLGHASIEEVVLPETLEVIGNEAFRNCRNLQHVEIPRFVREIGDAAFEDTVLDRINIPASVQKIGEQALITFGAHHGNIDPTLHVVEVDAENERFYRAEGLVLERKESGASRVILCTDDSEIIRIPDEVDEIAPYAFNGTANIRELYISDKIATVGVRGLATSSPLELIHIDVVKPMYEHDFFELTYPKTDRGYQQMGFALSIPQFVNVFAFFEHYDASIVNASSFDSMSEDGLDLYEQAKLVMNRLEDPVFLTDVNRGMYENILNNHIEDICVEVTKHDDRDSMNKLLDLGFLNADNILRVIDRISPIQDAAMIGFLLEVQRERFASDDSVFGIDFDL